MNNKNTNNKNLFKLGDFMNDALLKFRISCDSLMLRVRDIWEEALGSFVSEHTKPAVFKDGLLIVDVNNPAMMQQLFFLKKEVIVKLNKAIGKDVIKDIKFKAGANDL